MATTESNDSANNTKLAPHKYRLFMITLNLAVLEFFDEIMEYLKSRKMCNYIIACKHNKGHNEETKEHIHIVVQFTNGTTLDLKRMHGAHIDVGKFGSVQCMVNYVKGETGHDDINDFNAEILEEYGEMNKRGGKSIKEVKEMTQVERENLPVQYYNIVKKINEEENYDIDIDDWHKEVKVIYVDGPSGAGKTEFTKTLTKQYAKQEKLPPKVNIVKHEGEFWHNIGSAKIAIYDDFRDSHMSASEFINFIDYNKHTLNVKGGSKMNEYNLILISSIQNLENIYGNLADEPRTQWMRRIIHYRFDEINNKFVIVSHQS